VTPLPTFVTQCTPPPCATDEYFYCPGGDCPGGCGVICATHVPSETPDT
jgi:hypothetical protein